MVIANKEVNAKKQLPITGDTAGNKYNTVNTVLIAENISANISLISVSLDFLDIVVGLWVGC